jgi:lipoic acid synthetase
VLKANPDIVAHNLETVERLTPSVRSRATYQKSLSVIAHIAKNGYLAKSGIMVGLGETQQEVEKALSDLAAVGCKAVTIGQYLQPRGNNLPVEEYVTPEVFEMFKAKAKELGFKFVESDPLVRSSYHAEETAKQSE